MTIAAAQRAMWTGLLDYELPSDLIAQAPCPHRDGARLMLVDRSRQTLEHLSMADLPKLLAPLDLVVANDSRVVPARIVAHRLSGGRVELLLLDHGSATVSAALAKSSKPLRIGEDLVLEDSTRAKVSAAAQPGSYTIDFGGVSVEQITERLGRVPLPPYIRRGEEAPGDRERYQTVYARVPGSVAAPTAGLHFTPEMLDTIRKRGARFATLTLHVGPATFRPIRGDSTDHALDAESVMIGEDLVAEVNAARARRGRVVAVGTTTVRALETAAQGRGRIGAFAGETRLFIRPGHEFSVCDALLTNFHLPRSSLLCLVIAFAGEALVHHAYEEAVRRGYRFYSYGDAMLIV